MPILKKGFPHPVKIFEQNYTKKTIYPGKFSFVQLLIHFCQVLLLYRNQCIDGQLSIPIYFKHLAEMV